MLIQVMTFRQNLNRPPLGVLEDDSNLGRLDEQSRLNEQQFSALMEVENAATCPQCFLRPRGKYFTYFQCGHLLCSSCFASNKPKFLCPCCMKVSLVRYDGH